MISTHVRSALLLLAVVATPLGAQTAGAPGGGDVEALGRHYGTRPPQAYYDLKARNPDAFTFARAWKNRNPHLRRLEGIRPDGRPTFEVRAPATVDGGTVGPAALGPRDGPVSGTIRVPLVLGLFQDSPALAPFTRDRVQQEFFDGPNSHNQTITEFYDEISGGRVELLGETTDWKRSSYTRAEVAGGGSGLTSQSKVGLFILSILNQNRDVDWGRYDNDGPDGNPNSGDDDGYVDVLTVMHPTFGAECIGDRSSDYIWSHKWDLQEAAGQAWVSETPAEGHPGNIKVLDYTIQPVFACPPSGTETPTEINQIGVLAHELGHGFGLPDLYDTGNQHRGIGRWGLMGGGSWGCSASSGPERPCHMSGWSKEQLGWADVVTLGPDLDLGTVTFEPVEQSGKVYRVDAPDGSGEYFLLENRQKLGFDRDLLQEGLLVWHIDPDVLEARWPINSVNADGTHMGVHLLQADGENDLGSPSGNSGDPGDPFPGSTGRTAFHAGTTPGAWTWGGAAAGLTLTDIDHSGDDMTARVLTRFQQVTLESSGDGGGAVAFAVDGAPVDPSSSFTVAPFQEMEIEAGAGGEVSDGVRVGFLGWEDDASLGRVRTFVAPPEDVVLTATYGGREVRARVRVEGEEFGVPAGEVVTTPSARVEDGELWFPEGTEVTFQATANTGYGFEAWTGPLAGRPNPAVHEVVAPMEVSAVFGLTYGFGGVTHEIEAARQQEITLLAENGTDPVSWSVVSGALPRGLRLKAAGLIDGVAFEAGTFTVTLQARDANGLQATGDLVLEVAEPALGLDALTAPFLATSGGLSSLETAFLDVNGNDNGVYDLGDFRAWVLAHPDLPSTVEERALVKTLLPMIRFQPGGGR